MSVRKILTAAIKMLTIVRMGYVYVEIMKPATVPVIPVRNPQQEIFMMPYVAAGETSAVAKIMFVNREISMSKNKT